MLYGRCPSEFTACVEMTTDPGCNPRKKPESFGFISNQLMMSSYFKLPIIPDGFFLKMNFPWKLFHVSGENMSQKPLLSGNMGDIRTRMYWTGIAK